MKKTKKVIFPFITRTLRFHLIENAALLSFLGKRYMNLCDSTPDSNSASF